MTPELSEKIELQMDGLTSAFNELFLAAQANEERNIDPIRVQCLLDVMPRRCPYPASISAEIVKQFNLDRDATLTEIYNITRMEPEPPAYLARLTPEMNEALFVTVAATDPIEDSDFFEQVRDERALSRLRNEGLLARVLDNSVDLTVDQKRELKFEGLMRRIEQEMAARGRMTPELSSRIDYQMTGLLHAMVEVALASHPSDERVFDAVRLQRLLDTMPVNCPYPCSLSRAMTRQFDFDRYMTLKDVYDLTRMRPAPEAFLRDLDDMTRAELFISLASRSPIMDNEIFEEERTQ